MKSVFAGNKAKFAYFFLYIYNNFNGYVYILRKRTALVVYCME